jgi:hypothetical protein
MRDKEIALVVSSSLHKGRDGEWCFGMSFDSFPALVSSSFHKARAGEGCFGMQSINVQCRTTCNQPVTPATSHPAFLLDGTELETVRTDEIEVTMLVAFRALVHTKGIVEFAVGTIPRNVSVE